MFLAIPQPTCAEVLREGYIARNTAGFIKRTTNYVPAAVSAEQAADAYHSCMVEHLDARILPNCVVLELLIDPLDPPDFVTRLKVCNGGYHVRTRWNPAHVPPQFLQLCMSVHEPSDCVQAVSVCDMIQQKPGRCVRPQKKAGLMIECGADVGRDEATSAPAGLNERTRPVQRPGEWLKPGRCSRTYWRLQARMF